MTMSFMEASRASHPGAELHVVDDDPAVLRGITLLLRSAGMPTVCHLSAVSFLRALDTHGPQRISCLLTDLRMPGMDAIVLLRRLAARGVSLPVIVMTAHADVACAVNAMKAGAADFIEKPFEENRLLTVLRQHMSGRVHPASSDVAPMSVEAPANSEPARDAAARVAALTSREDQVLRLLTHGGSNKAIARDLGLSPRTVEVHRAHLMGRLGATSLAEAVRLAMLASRAPG